MFQQQAYHTGCDEGRLRLGRQHLFFAEHSACESLSATKIAKGVRLVIG